MDKPFVTALFLGAIAVFALPILLFNDRQKRGIAKKREQRGEEHVVKVVEARHHALWTTFIVTAVVTSVAARWLRNPVWVAILVLIVAMGTYVASRRFLGDRARREASRAAVREKGEVEEAGLGQLLVTVLVIAAFLGFVVLRAFFPKRPGLGNVAWVMGGSLLAVFGLLSVWMRYQLRHVRSVSGLLRCGDFEGAELELRRKLESEPNSGSLNMLYGSVLLELKRYDEAAEAFERAEADTLQRRGARVNRGIALWCAGREAEGEALLVEATAEESTTAITAAAQLATRLGKSGRIAESRDWLARAEELLAKQDWLVRRGYREGVEKARVAVAELGITPGVDVPPPKPTGSGG